MTLELTTLATLRQTVADWRRQGDVIALVPTMGALHDGHLALVKAAQKHASRVVVSIFVNPTQFGPNEDFSRYPRTLARDLELLKSVHADAAWLPSVEEMYPQGFATRIEVPGVSDDLEGAIRPGHFSGVATVVAKLLIQVAPDHAMFGEKDYQQLCVIKRLVTDLTIPTQIHGVPTLRDADGLALSSRNQYLSAGERAIAPAIHRTLRSLADKLGAGEAMAPALAQAKAEILAAGFAQVDYLELRAEESLAPISAYAAPARLLIAARLGTTRLIDNLAC